MTEVLAIPTRGYRTVTTPDGLDDVMIRRDHLAHIVESGKGNREQFANYILPTLQTPLEVWLTEREGLTPTGRKTRVFRRRFIAAFDEPDKKQSLVVVDENKDGSVLWTFITQKTGGYTDGQRAGFLLYRRRERQ